MTSAVVIGAAPLALLGLSAVLAMLAAPRAPVDAVRAVSAAGIAAALLAAFTTTAVSGSGLLSGDGRAQFGTVLSCLAGLAALGILRPTPPAKEAPALIAIATLGGGVLSGATHAATVFLGLEVITLSLVALITLPRTPRALEAGYKFLVLGGLGAAMLLMGLALGYAQTGSLDLVSWSARGVLVSLGAALVLAGIAFKFALVPFHMWTPDIFSGAAAPAALLAGVSSKVGVALVLLRLAEAGPPEPSWRLGLGVLGSASILLGNLQAMRQTSLTRMLGYSSIAHSGYLAVILASGAPIAPEAVLFTLAAYGAALCAGLGVATVLGGVPQLDDLRGLIWRNPLAGAALALAMVSLAGLPISVGFLTKLYLFTALIEGHNWLLLIVAAMGSALAFFYYLRFALAPFREGGPAAAAIPQGRTEAAVLALCALVIIVFGIYPTPLVEASLFALR